MKTNLLKLLMAFLGLLLIGCVLSRSLSAQTIISLDTTTDDSMVMKIQDHDVGSSEHTFILIFDGASVRFEFDQNGAIALRTENVCYNGPTSTFYINTGSGSTKNWQQGSAYSQEVLHSEEVTEEEPVELETWMMSPDTWLN